MFLTTEAAGAEFKCPDHGAKAPGNGGGHGSAAACHAAPHEAAAHGQGGAFSRAMTRSSTSSGLKPDRRGSLNSLAPQRTMTTSFFTGETPTMEEEAAIENAPWHVKLGRAVGRAIYSHWFESAIGTVILLNFVLICLDSDARAEFPGRSEGHDPPSWVGRAMAFCYCVFCLELLMRIGVERLKVFHNPWNFMDLFIIITGGLEYTLEWSGVVLEGSGVIRAIRLTRLLRLIRAMRLFTVLKELRKLVLMMGSCFRTLFWSCFLLVMVMTLWAIILVELVNPFIVDLAEQGKWPGCERCPRAYSSVWMANITLFQTIVAGDSWGYLAIPVIEVAPWTAVIFSCSLMTLVFGVLSLTIAVVVDTFAESRAKDVFSRASEMEDEEVEEKKILCKIFEKIDEDQDGTLSLKELEVGARKVAEFRHWLRVLDIDAHDLQELFSMIDHDESGEIDPKEFIEAMYRMKNSESKTATRFVKHMVTGMNKKAGDLELKMGEVNTRMASWETALEKNLSHRDTAAEEAGDAQLLRYQQEVEELLRIQEGAIQKSIELAMKKASEVALEVALEAAAMAAKNMLGTVSGKKRAGAHPKLRWQQEFSESSIRSHSPRRDLSPASQPDALGAKAAASIVQMRERGHGDEEHCESAQLQGSHHGLELGEGAQLQGPRIASTAQPAAFLPTGFQRVPMVPQAQPATFLPTGFQRVPVVPQAL